LKLHGMKILIRFLTNVDFELVFGSRDHTISLSGTRIAECPSSVTSVYIFNENTKMTSQLDSEIKFSSTFLAH
jgi:hypothetical protein